jgi:P27 family predicted phage terminase small subunit
VVVTPVDRTALSILCTSWARHVEAEQRLADGELVVKTSNGHDVQSQWLGISNRAAALHAKLCAEFGLTPSSRTRIHTGVPPKPAELEGAPKKGWSQFS